jgi:nicotinamide riboside kinase
MKSNKLSVAITGPECSGKTSLALHLTEVLGGNCVPEMARTYLEGKTAYHLADVIQMAEIQSRVEREAKVNHNIAICDTDSTVFMVWAQEKFGAIPPEIERYHRESVHDLWLLCSPDLPWEADPLRENPHDRHRLFELYYEILTRDGRPFRVISGTGTERLEMAESFVTEMKKGLR